MAFTRHGNNYQTSSKLVSSSSFKPIHSSGCFATSGKRHVGWPPHESYNRWAQGSGLDQAAEVQGVRLGDLGNPYDADAFVQYFTRRLYYHFNLRFNNLQQINDIIFHSQFNCCSLFNMNVSNVGCLSDC